MKASCGGRRRPCYSWSQRAECQLPVSTAVLSSNSEVEVGVYLSYAHDLGQAGLGAVREAGRPCVLATIVIRTYINVWATFVTALLLLSYAITRHTHGS